MSGNPIGEGIKKMFTWAIPNRKYVYTFSEGSAEEYDLLGKKGANLCEMFRLGLPVPHGFVISTEASLDFKNRGGDKLDEELVEESHRGIRQLEKETGKSFGKELHPKSPKQQWHAVVPLLLSVRADSPITTVPGLSTSILNLGINDDVVELMLKASSNPRWVYDTYRRFLQMFGTTVNKIEAERYESISSEVKSKRNVEHENHLSTSDLMYIVDKFKEFTNAPQNPWEQLGMAIETIMQSNWSQQAVQYRDIHNLPDDLGTGVVIQEMVYGNRNAFSGSGIAFTRDPTTGEKGISGEYLPNSEGEDVLSGVCTPMLLTALAKEQATVYHRLSEISTLLERVYRDIQTIEFTVESGVLYVLETRSAYRTAEAAAHIACAMVRENFITEREALLRVDAVQMQNYLHGAIDKRGKESSDPLGELLGHGRRTSYGAITGQLVFDADTAAKVAQHGKPVILFVKTVRDIEPLTLPAIGGVIIAIGGAGVEKVAMLRGLGKESIVDTEDLTFDLENKQLRSKRNEDVFVNEYDFITMDGSTGMIYAGELPMIPRGLNQDFQTLLQWSENYKFAKILAEAHTADQAQTAKELMAEGIGLCRLECILLGQDCVDLLRYYLLAENENDRKSCLQQLHEKLQGKILQLLTVMVNSEVMIQLADFSKGDVFPSSSDTPDTFHEEMTKVASHLGLDLNYCKEKVKKFESVGGGGGHYALGLRGCRMLIFHQDLLRMQLSAILDAAIQAKLNEFHVEVTIMVPMIFTDHEMEFIQREMNTVKTSLFNRYEVPMEPSDLKVNLGAMLSTPRSCMRADRIAMLKDVKVMCFDLNTLTELVFGMSKSDSHLILPTYEKKQLLGKDPFKSIDARGVGTLVCLAVMRARETTKDLTIGMCGEQAGDPITIKFACRERFHFITCHTYMVPTAKIAAAQVRIDEVIRDINRRIDEQRHVMLYPVGVYPL
jgi:pyruvate,orthophosphate dikinase